MNFNQHSDEKRGILNKAVELGLITIDDSGYLTLTAEGKKRAKTELPPQIEESIKDR